MSEMSKWVRVKGLYPQWSESEKKQYEVGDVRSTDGWKQEDYVLLLNMQLIEPSDPPATETEKKGK
jgi:hypothetical protein